MNVPTGSNKNGTEATHTPHNRDSLSQGALIGAVVGGTAGALAIAGLVVLCIFRGRKRRATIAKQGSSANLAPQDTNREEVLEHLERIPPYAQEMLARPDPRELTAETRPLELANDRAAAVRQKRLLQGMNSPVEIEHHGMNPRVELE